MKIIETHSHLNGLEFLLVHQPCLWEEIIRAIDSVDAEACKTKVSREKKTLDQIFYNSIALSSFFKKLLTKVGWHESCASYSVTIDEKMIRKTLLLEAQEQKKKIEEAGELPIFNHNQTDFYFLKNRVAIEIQFGKYSFVAYDLFVKHLAFYMGDKIDVGIEILPMKALQMRMSSGVAYYEGELYNVIRQGRAVPAVPLVILGIAP